MAENNGTFKSRMKKSKEWVRTLLKWEEEELCNILINEMTKSCRDQLYDNLNTRTNWKKIGRREAFKEVLSDFSSRSI